MTKEDRNLLLIDLCARAPYNVKVCYDNKVHTIDAFVGSSFIISETPDAAAIVVYPADIKPYLFPLSSITEEQSRELFKLFGISVVDSVDADYIKINECTGITFFLNKGFDIETHLDKLIEYLLKNHFDYRGLIPKDLAIDATNLNIYGKRI